MAHRLLIGICAQDPDDPPVLGVLIHLFKRRGLLTDEVLVAIANFGRNACLSCWRRSP